MYNKPIMLKNAIKTKNKKMLLFKYKFLYQKTRLTEINKKYNYVNIIYYKNDSQDY